MDLCLRKLAPEDEAEFIALQSEFMNADGRVYPGVLRKFAGDYLSYLRLLDDMADEARVPEGYVPSDTYVLADARGRLYGVCSLRRRLNDELIRTGGHIGYGVRPSEREKGRGTTQLLLALARAREAGISRALVTCNHDNIASARVIENNGGVFENEIAEPDGGMVKRYWIHLENPPVAIRRARRGDDELIRPLQEQIALLHYEGRPDLFKSEARYFTPEAFNARIDNPDHYIWIATDERGSALGYAFANIVRYRNHSTYRDFDSFYVDDVCVHERARRRGIGRRLFDKCLNEARAHNCVNVELGVWSFNAGAMEFYERMGMRERVRRMEYKI